MLTTNQNEIMKLIRLAADTEGRRQFDAFGDFLGLAFHSMVGATTLPEGPAWEKNEAAYMAIVERYHRKTKEGLDCHCRALAVLVAALEHGEGDVLGPIFAELAASAHAGQFFTPMEVCRMMARITLHDDIDRIIAEQGVLRICEPTVGCGAMVIALAEELKSRGVRVNSRVHFTMVDIDLKCVQAAYIQCNLLGMNATVIHGDSLSLETWGAWRTLTAIVFPNWYREKVRAPDDPPAAMIDAKALPVTPLGQLTFDLTVPPGR